MRGRVNTAEFVRGAHDANSFVADGRPECAFVGRSNVGKSSLLNRLVGQKGLARVSSTPGRTQAVNYFLINGKEWLVDLPGYGFAKTSKESRRRFAALTEAYLERKGQDSGFELVQLVDGYVGATELDLLAHRWLNELGIEPIVVATKIDRVKSGQRHAALGGIRSALALEQDSPVAVSSKTGEGIPDLWKAINARREAEVR